MGVIVITYSIGYYRGMVTTKETVKRNLENAAREQDTIVAAVNDTTTCLWIPKISIKSHIKIKQ